MSRRHLCLQLAAVLLLTVAGPAIAQPKPATWDFVLNVAMTHPVAVMEKEFVDEVRKRTGGRLNIVMRPPGELPYKLPEYLRATGQGSVQMGDVYMGFLAGDSKIAVLTGLPFLVGTPDELRKAMVVLEPLIREDFARFGADILTWFTWPEQNVFGRGKPITGVDDFKGRKIRTTSPEQSEMMKRLGAVPISLTAPEVPSAAQRGVMDGLITAAFNLLGAKWHEFTEWSYVTDIHIGGPAYILVNRQALAELPPDVRKHLQDAAGELQAKMLKEIPAREYLDRDVLAQQHKIKFYKASAADVARARKVMEPYWDEWAQAGGPKLVEALAQVKKAIGR
jgi:TRAP-type C4-dicarboxylate transport system substrate-binding protein